MRRNQAARNKTESFMTTITNQNGTEINFDAAVALMDSSLREQVAANGVDTEQAFFLAYADAHREMFGEEFEPNKANPVW
jgi:hypothetical protein